MRFSHDARAGPRTPAEARCEVIRAAGAHRCCPAFSPFSCPEAIPQVEAIGQALQAWDPECRRVSFLIFVVHDLPHQATRNETYREIFTQLYLGFENLAAA